MLIRRLGQSGWHPGAVEFDAEGLTLRVETLELERRAPFVRGGEHAEPLAEETLAALGQALLAQGYELRCCASCMRFRPAAKASLALGGRFGHCSLAGARSIRAPVRVDQGCGEQLPGATWPADLETLQKSREHLARLDEQPSRLSAFEGCLVGVAVGDALGYPAEFRTRAQILASLGPEGLTDFVAMHDARWPERPHIVGPRHPPGTYSDDTQMTVATARALLTAGAEPLDALMHEVAHEYVVWADSPHNDRAPGETCMLGCESLKAGKPWSEAGLAESKGCGSAMRVAPIGLYFASDRRKLLEVARASSLLTHRHPAAVEGAAAAALLVALALDKAPPDKMYEAVKEECAPRSADFAACWARLAEHRFAPPELALSEQGLGEGWVAEEAVASALYCFWRSPQDFRATVLTAANTDGDSDSIAAIAGSISGAFNGIDGIPEGWRDRVEDGVRLRQLAGALGEAVRRR